jgi:catechol 2,3-dioxygenase-like lactoylglutathione lyase family enzyme
LKIGRLNHIALAVPDLEKATALYRDVLGGNVSKPDVSNPRINLFEILDDPFE